MNSEKDLPSYTSGTHGTAQLSDVKDVKLKDDNNNDNRTPPVYSASPNPPAGGRRLLHMYHEGWTRKKIQILDSDKVTPLYTVQANRGSFFSSKPHITIQNALTGAVVGTVTFQHMSRSIDLQIHGEEVTFDKPKVFTTSHIFRSVATGRNITWKRDGILSGGDLICINEEDQVYATFEINAWAAHKDGKFELGADIQGPLMDEIMVSGLAAVEFQRRQRQRSCSSGGGGA